ncbi:efflux RND transporter periplasmic adaptor subunit [Photobacterium sp. SDRW27]|uniref:efflux RND transporter periplasmic adaptor subunit n=1 Tax=Photobacterium obscurum TaxID=2829490 RepID=UPI002242F578|nr:efflux RND transporter periplasmic adaptor subunit [Photobacterium obscurum]MCW8327605.1 efflux RND transporter periplasmic adaptor subunit [Photobacterium obscurum]
MKQSLTVTILALAVGGALGYFAAIQTGSQDSQATSSGSNEPLYWVAPMDPNYKRDKPGKSPMGMDLIPVYEEDLAGGDQDQAGTISVSPAVENSLGVKTAKVSQQQLMPEIDTVGYVTFDESRLWQINSRVSGWIQKLNVSAIGEKVKKDEVLFEIYSPDLVRAQEELLNAKRIGKAVLVKGAKERLASLGVDRSQTNEVLRRGKAKQNIAIKAPADGIIASLNVRNGAFLSPQQTVISGGSLDNIWVDAEIFERQAHWIKQGTNADMRIDALPGKSWQGTVDYVYPILDPKTRTLRVRLKFANPNGALKPNMFANLTMIPRSNEAVLAVPDQAVIRAGNMTRVVLALGDGKFRSTRVETGRVAGGMVEITQGLSAQDTVVTSAHFMLDSESSQSADLSRIAGPQTTTPANTAIATGTVRGIMLDHNMLTIEHAPVEAWGWPTMTMNFTVSDDSDLSQLVGGQAIRFLIEKTNDNQYTISEVTADGQASPSAQVNSVPATGVIRGIMTDHNMLTIEHAPVDAWGWPAMTMNFTVSDDSDLTQFNNGQSIRFTLEKSSDSQYSVSQIKSAQTSDTKEGAQ